MKKYEEENYKYENICDKIYPWVKTELTDSHALNGKHFSKKDAPVISFLGDLNVVFAIKCNPCTSDFYPFRNSNSGIEGV